MSDPNSPKGFATLRSLQPTASTLGGRIESLITQADFCLGYHMRHFLQSDHRPVAVRSSDKRSALELLNRNAALGLHTVNHVIDSLYGFETGTRENLAILLRVRYGGKSSGAMSRDAKRVAETDKHAAEVVFPGWRVRYLSIDALEAHDARAAARASHTYGLSSALSQSYDAFVPAAHRLCAGLDVAATGLASRALAAAIYQLETYAKVFGPETFIAVLRLADPFSFATGITTITREALRGRDLTAILTRLREQSEKLSLAKPVRGVTTTAYVELVEYPGLDFAHAHNVSMVPDDVIAALEEEHNTGQSERSAGLWFHREGVFAKTTESFIQLCSLFCEERYEGRDLQFAVVLGNPFLLKFWPGPVPVPASHVSSPKRQRFFDCEKLPKQIHLLENPAERCLVVPYQQHAGSGQALAGYCVELEDFQEALATRSMDMWASALAPYVYLTKRFPWAIASIVGPHSEMRIFSRGRLMAFRDGKGWRTYRDAVLRIESEKDGVGYFEALGDDAERHKAIVRALAELALQLSPIARPGSHGGLLVYAPTEVDDSRWRSKEVFQPLALAEPEKLEGGMWLTGQSLISADMQLDRAVAQRAIRASVLDGAIVLGGSHATVLSFATRVNAAAKDSGPTVTPGGSKRATAEAFVRSFAEGKPGPLAFAASADGPVRLTYYSPSKRDAVTIELFDMQLRARPTVSRKPRS